MSTQSVNGRVFAMTVVICSLFYACIFVAPAEAQILPASGLQLLSNPQFPAPGGEVRVSIEDSGVNTLGTTISWFVNGTEKKEFLNERTISLTMGDLGSKTTVRAVLSRSSGVPLASTLILSPSVIDVVVEAKSYVPAFYRGRPLPSDEGSARAIAVVHDGTATADTSYSYKWTLGRDVLFGGPVRGKNVAEFSVRYGEETLAVEVYDSTGSLVGRNVTSLSTADPEVHFYEHSPLRGLFERAAEEPYALIGNETTIYGEPYYLDISDLSGADVTWEIDGVATPSTGGVPNAMTLRTEGASGSALLELAVVTKKRIPQYVQKSLRLFFD